MRKLKITDSRKSGLSLWGCEPVVNTRLPGMVDVELQSSYLPYLVSTWYLNVNENNC
jgi:hypothetical protein